MSDLEENFSETWSNQRQLEATMWCRPKQDSFFLLQKVDACKGELAAKDQQPIPYSYVCINISLLLGLCPSSTSPVYTSLHVKKII